MSLEMRTKVSVDDKNFDVQVEKGRRRDKKQHDKSMTSSREINMRRLKLSPDVAQKARLKCCA